MLYSKSLKKHKNRLAIAEQLDYICKNDDAMSDIKATYAVFVAQQTHKPYDAARLRPLHRKGRDSSHHPTKEGTVASDMRQAE